MKIHLSLEIEGAPGVSFTIVTLDDELLKIGKDTVGEDAFIAQELQANVFALVQEALYHRDTP